MLALTLLLAFATLLAAMALAVRACASPFGHVRKTLFTACSLVTLLAVGAAILSPVFKGPASHHAAGSLSVWIRTWVVLPGDFASLLLPVCCMVALVKFRRPTRRPTWLVLMACALLTIPPSLALALFIGCNHAGECL